MLINKPKIDETRSNIIIYEGAQGAGKTSIAEYTREHLSFANLYRLAGNSDKTMSGRLKAINMYEALLRYMKDLEGTDINLIFDRIFFSEENYCRLGYKDYSFTDDYFKLVERLNKLDFNIYVIFLYLKDTTLFESRLQRDKTEKRYKFNALNSINQQETYLEMASELECYNNINPIVINTDDFIEAKQRLRKFIDLS